MYDGEGRNISRKTNGKSRLFVYDGNTVIYETGMGGAAARNVYGVNLISRTVSGATALYGYNGHGDVINLTSEGNVVAAYYYDEFGNHADIENHAGVFAELFTDEESAGFDNPYRYAGYEYLENADLYDLNARYYDPDTARFLSPDPYYNLGNRVIGLYEINVPNAWSIIQANALYVYCGNNPVLFSDSSGTMAAEATVAATNFWNPVGWIAGGILTVEVAAVITGAVVYHAKKSKKSGKETASDVPSWAKGKKPQNGENGKKFAKRLMDEKYGEGNYDTGTNTEYSKIKKFGDRGAR